MKTEDQIAQLLTPHIQANNAEIGETNRRLAFIGDGQGNAQPTTKLTPRDVFYRSSLDQNDRGVAILAPTCPIPIQAINGYYNTEVWVANVPGSTQVQIVDLADVGGYSTGGPTPLEGLANAAAKPSQDQLLILRLAPPIDASLSVFIDVGQLAAIAYEVGDGTYGFIGSTSLDISDPTNGVIFVPTASALASGEHRLIGIALDPSSGQFIAIPGVAASTTNTLPSADSRSAFTQSDYEAIDFTGYYPAGYTYNYYGQITPTEDDIMRLFDPRLVLNKMTAVAPTGTVTNVSWVTADGLSASIANPTTTPAITPALGAITPDSAKAKGTGGAGFFEAVNQSASPATPSSAWRLFADASNRLAVKFANGFKWAFAGIPTADRIITYQDASGTVAYLTDIPTDTDYYQTLQKAAASATQRGKINFLEGTNISIVLADNSGNDSTDVTIGASDNVSSKDLFSATGTANVANTSSETTLLGSGVGSLILGANTLAVGKGLEFEAWGIMSTLGALPGTLNIKFKLGSVVIVSTGAISLVAGLAAVLWKVRVVLVTVSTGASGTVRAEGKFSITNLLADTTEQMTNGTSTVTIDTTVTETVDLTATFSAASASNSITSTNTLMRLIDITASSGAGIDELTGGVIAGPGSGSEVATLPAKFLIQTADSNLPNAQVMGALTTGLVKNTTTTGLQSIATAGADYTSPTGAENLSNKTINTSDIGTTTPGSGYFSALRLKIGGFFAIFTHANSANRTVTLQDADGTIAFTNQASQGYVRTGPAATADNLISAATATIRALALKTTDGNTTNKLLEFLSSAGAVLASISATGLAVFAGVDNTPVGATTASTGYFTTFKIKVGGFFATITHAFTANRTVTLPGDADVTLVGVDTTQTLTNKTLTTPTIGDFTNAAHSHQNAAGAGQLNAGSVFSAGQVPLARGGTNADLSGSGGATKFLAQDASHVISARDLVADDYVTMVSGLAGSGVKGAVPAPGSGDVINALFGDATFAGTGRKLVARTVLGASAANIDLNPVSAAYEMLLLIMELRSDRAASTVDNVYIRFNNDSTAANYYSYSIIDSGTTPTETALERLGATATGIEINQGAAAATATADERSYLVVQLYSYADSARQRHAIIHGMGRYTTATGNLKLFRGLGDWTNVANSITRITILPVNGANWVAGSSYMLYGFS